MRRVEAKKKKGGCGAGGKKRTKSRWDEDTTYVDLVLGWR